MAAQIYLDLKKQNKLIGPKDILIAGVALANNIPLATKNKREFKRVKGLDLYELEI